MPELQAPWPSAHTRLVALLGWPVRHSLSPAMHNAAFREQRLDLVYLALPVPPEQLATVVAALGATGAVGANVTVPHKVAARELCDSLTDEAALIGAVNTLAWTTEGLVGDNTDAAGLADALTADGAAQAGDEVVLLGTGGAARAAAVATGRLGCRIQIVGRRLEAAEELAALARRAGAATAGATHLDDRTRVEAVVAGARTVVNATPLGMADEQLPPPFTALTRDQVAYDLVYTPPETPFLAAAAARGARTHHGLGMLVGQAAAAYRRWTAREAPVATMSAAAISALFGARTDDEAPAG